MSPPTPPLPTAEQFLAEHGPYLRKIIAIGSLSLPLTHLGIDLEDLYQESYMLAIEARKRYDPTKGTSLKTWVVNRVRLMLQEYYNKLQYPSTTKLSYQPFHASLFGWLECPSDIFEYEIIADFTEHLTPFGQEVLRYRVQGYSMSEIASKMAARLGTVRGAMREIRNVAENKIGMKRPIYRMMPRRSRVG